MNYATLDTQAARQADFHDYRITETGKYKGRFEKAEVIIAKTGSKGNEFTFKSDAGQTVNFSIYTHKSSGEKMQGYTLLNSIMVCLKLRSISMPIPGRVKKFNFDTKQDEFHEVPLLMDLINKPIGVVLQNREYEKQVKGVKTGEYAWRLELKCAFDYATELTAGEILNGSSEPKVLSSIMAHLRDWPAKKHSMAMPSSSTAGTDADLNDDIPF